VLPVLQPVGGVDHQQVLIRPESVEIGVVHGSARCPVGIMVYWASPGSKAAALFGEDVLQKRQSIRTAHAEPSHVGYIEKAGAAAGRQVFLYDPGGIL